MKKIRLALLISLFGFLEFSNAIAQEKPEIHWVSFEEAIALNKKLPKKIFVDIYTQWCGWCKRMDATTFSDPSVVKYMNENYYSVKLDAEKQDTIHFNGYNFVYLPERKANELAVVLMQNRLSGYPSSAFLNENVDIISSRSGYLSAADFFPMIKYFGENGYINQTFDEFQKSNSTGSH